MKITGGKFRRLNLRGAPALEGLRPTVRRLREILFERLASRIEGARFLDLCAGSGAVGLEALSRGAAHVTFVESAARACDFIAANLKACGVARAQGEVREEEVLNFLRLSTADEGRRWDIAFYDPPYSNDYEPVLEIFGAGAALEPRRGVLVVEHHCEKRLAETRGVLRRWRVVRQGESCLSFYERRR
ncbi:MAG TPA: 16S rRNA (guanine(966)-N(2))-methyltransferase RsmD [Pyrinomonadaceae bacterium]|nr:16S rRNA (guanine(966)-N(2))-methyltransferase RsmD [Pyrinomonadaceae bacterium]